MAAILTCCAGSIKILQDISLFIAIIRQCTASYVALQWKVVKKSSLDQQDSSIDFDA